MEVLTYSPDKVVLLICGYRVEGWTSISVQRNSPNFKQIRGIRGKNTRTRIVDSSATLSITLPQTEYANEVLSKCLALDIETGSARLEVTILDGLGDSFFMSTQAYITGFPAMTYTAGLSENSWVLLTDESTMNLGAARNAANSIIDDSVNRLKDFVTNLN